MKKMKALLFSLALGFSLAAAGCMGGLNNAESSSVQSIVESSSVQSIVESSNVESSNVESSAEASSSIDWFESDVVNTATVRFAAAQVDVRQYESIALGYTVRGTTEEVKFTSSDESIATVDANGVVTAKGKLGEVTITLTVGDISATCTVNVKESPYVPQIAFNESEYIIEAGETLQFTVWTEWNKQVFDEEVEYAVSFAENSTDAKAKISVEGNQVKVVSVEAEKIDIIISTTVRGIYTSETVTVNVIANKMKILPTTLDYKPVEGGYYIGVATTALMGDMVNSLPLAFVTTKGGEEVDDVTIEWSVEGDAAVITDGNIVGQKRGEATIIGTATDGEESATVQIFCEVIPPEVTLEQTAVIELQNLTTLTVQEELLGTLYNAELHGVQVSSRIRGKTMLFNSEALPKTASKLGAQKLILNTELVRYVMNVNIYTMIINDAAELDSMAAIANTGETEWSARFEKEANSQYFDGYFVLGNDIAYNGTFTSMTDSGSLWNVQGSTKDNFRGFKGIFDGMGYNIDGMTTGANKSGSAEVGGIFGSIAPSGIVRNVSFTNASILTNNGFICSMGDGLVENVSIQFKQLGSGQPTKGLGTGTTPATMGAFFSYQSGKNATVRNCLVDAMAANIEYEQAVYNNSTYSNVKLAGTASHIENVIVLCPDKRVLNDSRADVQALSYLDLMKESEALESLDKTVWALVEEIPMLARQAETIDYDMPINFFNTDSVLITGFEMQVHVDNPYTVIEVEDLPGITYKNGVITATEEAFDLVLVITATSLLNPAVSVEHTVYIDSFGEAVAAPMVEKTPIVYNTDSVLHIGDDSWMGDKTSVYLGKVIVGSGTDVITIDQPSFGWGTKEVTVVTIKDEVRTHFTMDITVWYKEGEFKDSELVLDSAFSTYKGDKNKPTFFDKEADIEAPEGYDKANRMDAYAIWESAIHHNFFNQSDISGYSDLWFGMKVVNAYYKFQAVDYNTTDWVFFHFVNLGNGRWLVEAICNDKVVASAMDVDGSAGKIGALLYRGGYADGFLIYNRGVDGITEENPSKIYVTEVRGIKG